MLLTKSFQGFKHKLFCLPIVRLWVCHVFCSLHSAFVTVASFVLQVTSFIPFHSTRYIRFATSTGLHSTSFISVTFSTPATNFSARLHSRSGFVQWVLIFSFANALQKNKPTHCPCVAIVWHKLR